MEGAGKVENIEHYSNYVFLDSFSDGDILVAFSCPYTEFLLERYERENFAYRQ